MKIEVKDLYLEKTIDEEYTDYLADRHRYTKEGEGTIKFTVDNKPFSCKAKFTDFSNGDNGSKSATVEIESIRVNKCGMYQFGDDEMEEIETELTEYIEEEYRKNGKDWD